MASVYRQGFGNEMAAGKVPTEAVQPATAKPNTQAGEDGTASSGWPRSTGDGLGVNEMALVAKLPPHGLHLRAS